MRVFRNLGAGLLVVALVSFAAPASAAVIPIGPGAFGGAATLTTFAGETNGGEVNGSVVDGILFSYSLGNGALIFDGGPGVTNNVNPLNIVSIQCQNEGTLTMTLPDYVDRFGFGYALLFNQPLAVAATISIFDGATFLGTLSYASAPDPNFTGGFAGIESTILFNRVEVVFNSTDAGEFALDNIRTENSAVPEPASLLLLGAGLAAAGRRLRRRA
jgi:hypothetical protein